MLLQNTLDLSTFEIVRFRIWNQTSHPDDKGVGTKYFNTNSGHEGYNRENIYTHSGWRMSAYMDDIDRINEKLDLIFGEEIDTDTIIDSWKEVQDFLAGIEDTANLMDLLNSKADKTQLANYLPLSGGTINGNSTYPLIVKNQQGSSVSIQITYADGAGLFISSPVWGVGLVNPNAGCHGIGVTDDGIPYFGNSSSKYTLLHSDNVGKYTLFEKEIKKLTSSDDLNNYKSGYLGWENADNPANGVGVNTAVLAFANARGTESFQLAFDANSVSNSIRFRQQNTSQVWSAWKTLAFTDSNVASAYKLITSSGADAVVPNANGYTFVYGDMWVWAQDASDRLVRLRNEGSDLYTRLKADGSGEIFVSGNYALKFGTANTARMLINSSGNVTIGDRDLAETDYKLYVNGRIGGANIFLFGTNTAYGIYRGDSFSGSLANTDIAIYATKTILGEGGNVGIGTLDPSEKLHVVGNLRVTGDILIPTGRSLTLGSVTFRETAAGEVEVDGNLHTTGTLASGGKGEAGTGSTGNAQVYQYTLDSGQSSYSVQNVKNNTNVIVQVYEWNSNTSSWDMILTDVNVKASGITVTFGRTTTVNHLVTVC